MSYFAFISYKIDYEFYNIVAEITQSTSERKRTTFEQTKAAKQRSEQ
jgi:hypothetical protein